MLLLRAPSFRLRPAQRDYAETGSWVEYPRSGTSKEKEYARPRFFIHIIILRAPSSAG